mgnify:CR=1 FL=1
MDLAERYARVKAALPPSVQLIAVSKTRSVAEIRALYALGHRAFGENYPQELRDKQAQLPEDIEWHFIGHLQRSNVKHIASFVHLIHGVDGVKLLDEIDKRAKAAQRTIDVLLQVHIAKEETKHGFSSSELKVFISSWRADRWPNVRVRGLMGMATNTEDDTLITAEFAGLASLFREIKGLGSFGDRFDQLSMGMTNDFGLAMAQGSTLVRIGTAIFGPR